MIFRFITFMLFYSTNSSMLWTKDFFFSNYFQQTFLELLFHTGWVVAKLLPTITYTRYIVYIIVAVALVHRALCFSRRLRTPPPMVVLLDTAFQVNLFLQLLLKTKMFKKILLLNHQQFFSNVYVNWCCWIYETMGLIFETIGLYSKKTVGDGGICCYYFFIIKKVYLFI